MKSQNKNLHLTKRKILLILGGVVTLVCIVILFITLTQPERSVANFCEVAQEEKSTLVGNVNYEKRLESYRKLEAVSPDEIRPDITTILKGYESIVKNPSSTLNAGFGMSGAENRRTAYINTNCKNF